MASKKQMGELIPGITFLKKAGNQYKKMIDKDWLFQKYVVEELPVDQIGRLANINPRLVTSRAVEYGFPKRTQKRRYKLRGQRNQGWSRGLTKEDHPGIKKISDRQKKNSHFTDPNWRKENLFTEEVVKKRSKGIKKALQAKWNNMTPQEKSAQLAEWWDGKTPNKTEAFLLTLCPDTIDFTGNGKHWVTFKCGRNKNPDYIVRPFKESKKVIEYFGSYWHPDEKEKDQLIKKYAEVGVECLVILEEELKDINQVQNKIQEFV